MPIYISGLFAPSGGTGAFNLVSASDIEDDIGLSITYVIDGGESVITTGSKGYLEIPFGCTIVRNTLTSDQTGSMVIDVKKSTYSGFPTTASICASAKPTLSAAQKSQDSTLTGWTTAITAGDILEYIVDSASTVTRVTLSLKVTKT